MPYTVHMALNKHTSECIFLQDNIIDWVPLGPGQMASQVTQVAWDLHQLVATCVAFDRAQIRAHKLVHHFHHLATSCNSTQIDQKDFCDLHELVSYLVNQFGQPFANP